MAANRIDTLGEFTALVLASLTLIQIYADHGKTVRKSIK